MAERSGEKGFLGRNLERFVQAPAKELAGVVWKVGAIASVAFLALGAGHTALKLGIISGLSLIAESELGRSIKKSPSTA